MATSSSWDNGWLTLLHTNGVERAAKLDSFSLLCLAFLWWQCDSNNNSQCCYLSNNSLSPRVVHTPTSLSRSKFFHPATGFSSLRARPTSHSAVATHPCVQPPTLHTFSSAHHGSKSSHPNLWNARKHRIWRSHGHTER